jgi:hypothetical protein
LFVRKVLFRPFLFPRGKKHNNTIIHPTCLSDSWFLSVDFLVGRFLVFMFSVLLCFLLFLALPFGRGKSTSPSQNFAKPWDLEMGKNGRTPHTPQGGGIKFEKIKITETGGKVVSPTRAQPGHHRQP